MRKLLAFILTIFLSGTLNAQNDSDTTIYVPENTIVKLSYNNDFVYFKMKNNKYAKAFIEMLPLTIYMDPYIENTTLVGSINKDFGEETTEPVMISQGDLFINPNLKQVGFIYDMYVGTYSVQTIGRQVGRKNIFKSVYNGAEVTFSVK